MNRTERGQPCPRSLSKMAGSREQEYVFRAPAFVAAQTFSLLYRRFTIGIASEPSRTLKLAGDPRNTILRYSRLKVCATLNTRGQGCPRSIRFMGSFHFLLTPIATVSCLSRLAAPALAALLALTTMSCREPVEPNTVRDTSTNSTALPLLDLQGNVRDPFPPNDVKATVFVFVNSTCPISNRYAPEMKRLHGRFAAQDVLFWLVYPDPDETADSIRKHMGEYQYPFDALRDPKHAFVKRTGVRVTPEVAVFDRNRQLVYHGRIDNRFVDFGKERPAATERDLEQVLEAIVVGKPAPKLSAPGVGCYIAQLP